MTHRRSSPAVRARATTASRSLANASSARWQWESIISQTRGAPHALTPSRRRARAYLEQNVADQGSPTVAGSRHFVRIKKSTSLNLDERDAVRLDLRLVPDFEAAGIAMPPEIVDGARAGEPKVRPAHLDRRRRLAAIEHPDGVLSAGQQPRPHLDRPAGAKPPALPAERVLIDRNHIRVRQNGRRLGRHGAEIVAGQQRRGKDRPQAHVRAVFA